LAREPVTAHWGIPDPVGVEGSEVERKKAFQSAWMMLRRRVDLLLALPLEKLDRVATQQELRAIGQVSRADEQS
jgi:arsenate reductase